VISVVIPVRNGGADFRRCLEAIARQRVSDEVQVVVVDSSSTDGSDDVARAAGALVETIPAAEFNHGATRNLGASLTGGETLVFTSQDAYADSDEWLARLTAPLAVDDGLAGVYGGQLPHADATPPERFFLGFLYGREPRTQRASDAGELTMETTLFSNANAAIRRRVWDAFPFADDLIMSEDQEWAARVLLAGYGLRYEPSAAVRHSHRYTIRSAFQRFFDSGVSADRAYLPGGAAAQRALRARAWRYGREEIAWLYRERKARWIPYAAVYELAKWAGLQLGIRHRRLPPALKRRFSAMPAYWD
jgi:rhamnosyltransferase